MFTFEHLRTVPRVHKNMNESNKGGADCQFFIEVCTQGADGSLFYLQGDVFTTRLCEKTISAEGVKLNYNLTLKYRASFKDE